MSDQLDLLDYYTLLGVEPSANDADIKAAFRKFARRYHPDRYAAADGDKLARSTQIYRRGSEAFQVLTNPLSRTAYDRVLRVGKTRFSADDRERAEISNRMASAPQKKAEAPIRSPQALAFYHKAADAARAGEWREAWRLMRGALELEPDNPLLRARLAQLEVKLRTAR